MVKGGKKWDCHGGSCYHFYSNVLVTKSEADEKCEQLGAHVVAMETEEEQDIVRELMNTYGKFIRFD